MSTVDSVEKLKYPIGKFAPEKDITAETIAAWIDDIAALPAQLKAAVEGLSAEQLKTPYRPGGWTVSQVIHHIGDSHLNAYIRFKLALTEDTPTIKPYDQQKWAELADSTLGDPEDSLQFVELLHKRWVILLKTLTAKDLERDFFHPETGNTIPLKRTLEMYAWHGKHHTAHITCLRERENW
jgi:uncharacterized damage-inducible protein DinB